MKKTLATAALALLSLLAAPSKAEAGHETRDGFNQGTNQRAFVSGRASCGCPIYSERSFRGRDRCGAPIFQIVRVPFRCSGACRAMAARPRDRGYGDGWRPRTHRDRRVSRSFTPLPYGLIESFSRCR